MEWITGAHKNQGTSKALPFSNLIKETSINHAFKMLEYYLSLLAIRITVTLYYYLSP